MSGLYELFKSYAALIGLIGMSFVQVLNFRPSDQSFLAFVFFSILAVLVIFNCVRMLRETKLVRRTPDFVREQVYSRPTRQAAAITLVLTLPVYAALVLLYHIPNTWPIVVRAGAESRISNPWLQALHGDSLDRGLGDEEAGRLFVPDRHFFSISPAVHRVTIDNRSTVSSPPLRLRLILQVPPGRGFPPAVFAAAVTSDAVRRWLPFGDVLSLSPIISGILSRQFPAGGILGGIPSEPHWLSAERWCRDSSTTSNATTGRWCFIRPPTGVTDLSQWREPEFRLPSIPPRGSLEVYLELAFHDQEPVQTIPVTLELREAAKGDFPVSVSRDVDLNAGSNKR